jgi:hypothetical protein
MACGHTSLATSASVKVDGERVLLSGRRRRKWNQVAIILRLGRQSADLMAPGKCGDRRQKLLLLAEQIVK